MSSLCPRKSENFEGWEAFRALQPQLLAIIYCMHLAHTRGMNTNWGHKPSLQAGPKNSDCSQAVVACNTPGMQLTGVSCGTFCGGPPDQPEALCSCV